MEITGQHIGLLGQRLRAARWKVGTAHEIDAERLLQQLRAMGALPDDVRRLAEYLGPIFCSEPDHQAAFEGHLREVLAIDAEVQPDRINPIGAKIASAGPWLGWLLSLALLVVVGMIAWGLVHRYDRHVVTVKVLHNKTLVNGAQVTLSSPPQKAVTHDGKAQVRLSRADLDHGTQGTSLLVEKSGLLPSTRQLATLPEGEIEVELAQETPPPPPAAPPTTEAQRNWSHSPPARQDDPKWHKEQTWRLSQAGLVATATPLLLAVAWAMFWWLHRRAWLQRLPRQTPQSITELSSRTRRTLAMYLDTGAAGHELRRRRWQHSPELNLEATLQGTLEKAGQPRLVFGSRVEPEYLALIDEGSSLDHMARLADELMLSLEARDVAIERYFFRGDPTLLSGPAPDRKPRGPSLPLLTLEQLAITHRDRRLIIVSDGGALFDPGTGYSLPCADTLLLWADVVLLTPTRNAQWGRREWALSRLGFTVLPLNGEGLMAMGELHASGKAAEPPEAAAAHRAPPRWVREPLAMLLPSAPQGTSTDRLCSELRDYLGPDAYLWLQACAVYPEMHWGMTLRLGAGLLDPGPRYTRALSLLVRLPWLRESYMPNWLREALRERLGRKDWVRVSDVIRQILEQAHLGRGGDLELRVGAPPRESLWRTRRDAPASKPPSSSPLPPPGPRRIHRDAVFLRFMQGPPQLAVPAVDWLRRLFFRDGLWSIGMRGLPIVVVAAIAAAVAGFYVPPYSIDSRVVLDKADKPATVTALTVAEGGEQPTVMVGYSNGEIWRVTRVKLDRWSKADGAVTGFLHAAPERGAFRVQSGATMSWGAEPAASAARADLPAGGRPLFDREGRLQALLSMDGTNLRWPDANGRTDDAQVSVPIAQPAGTLRCAAIAFDGSVVAVFDGKLHIVRRGSPPAPPVSMPIVTGCDLRPGGRVVVGWEPDAATGGVTLWRYNLHAQRLERAVPMKDTQAIDEFLAAADGNRVWVRQGTQVRAFDLADSRMHQTLPTPASRIAVTADANAVAIATPDGRVELWHSEAVRVDPRGARPLGVLFVLLSVSKNMAPPFSRSDFEERLVNGPLKAYFSENSGGRLSMATTVTDWIKIDASDSAYLRSPAPWMDQFRKALTQAELSLDLAALDKNNDGKVDAVVFVHDTIGAEMSAPSEKGIWSSSWRLSADGSKFSSSGSKNASGQAIEIDEFSIVSGVNAKGSMTTIGTIAHELGHRLGLHDQFDDQKQMKPVPAAGDWSLMASGRWIGDGARPTHISGPEKLLLGWVEPIESATGDVVLRPVQTSRTVVKLMLEKSDYLVLENRQQEGFDAGIPASGLLVWRVSEPTISLVSADGRNDIVEGRNSGSPGNPFPGIELGQDEATVEKYQIRKIRRQPDGSISMRIDEVSTNGSPTAQLPAASQPSASTSSVASDHVRVPEPLPPPPVPPIASGLIGKVKFEIFSCPTIDDRSDRRAENAKSAVASTGFPPADIVGPLQLTKQQLDQYFKPAIGSQIRLRQDNADQREAVKRLLDQSYLSNVASWKLVPVAREGQDAVRLVVCDPPRKGKPLSGTVVVERICSPRLRKEDNMPPKYWESVKSFTSRLKQGVEELGGTLNSSYLDQWPTGIRIFVAGNHPRDLLGARSLTAAPILRNDRLEVEAEAMTVWYRALDGIHIENCPPPR
ncbi:M6 family metalloprotease domain-containing protein [Variovorax sp. J22R115]|uniref:M6 family metalloprotease domain-containing protein n=1 Tax=Variovorax sp. J22R115 TaxID=3053509 RepID=UPI00257570EC|nr:M6 family metalloprotease domain-containing protein [Variovorax sp. J22R115]MDM0053551.1 M6 family metalloprotease domain-containing protein [Variovorax sp. J22R115]